MINCTSDGTCLIATVKDLCYLAVCVNKGDDCAGKTFKLVDDIDLTGVDFTPIGNDENNFNGTFDGDGHTISNLRINSSGDGAGLFGYVSKGGTIKNVNLSNVNISGNDYVGGLIGFNSGSVSNCAISGTVNGSKNVGGLVGWNCCGFVENSTANTTVSGNEDVGGLVGDNGGKIKNSTANATVSGNEDVGGLVGFNCEMIENCTVNATVSGNDIVGGIVGLILGVIKNCTANTRVSIKN